MTQTSELLKRLRRVPSDRRADFLKRLQGPTTDERFAPLSFRQEQLWVLNRFAPLQVSYNLAFGFQLSGELDHTALTGALEQIFTRHAILRSTFPPDEDPPLQKVQPTAPIELSVDDLTALPPELRRDRLSRAIELGSRQPFDFENGPLVRLRLFKLAEHEHLLLWLTHYMVFDLESARTILAELGELYGARCEGRSAQLSEMTLSYADFATWQRRWANQPEVAQQLQAWRDTLSGWQPTDLSPDLPRPATLDLAGAVVSKELPAGLIERSDELAQRLGIATDAMLLAAYAVLLQRYTRQSDVLIGLPVRQSQPQDVASLVGNCENLVPLRIDGAGDPSFAELATRINETIAHARELSNVPFKQILDIAQPARDPSRLPLVQVGFACERRPAATIAAGGLTITLEQIPTGTAAFEVQLKIDAGSTPQRASVEYNTRLFQPWSMSTLIDRFADILDAAITAPETRLSRLPVMSDAERAQVIETWNQTLQPRRPELIHEVFQAQALQHPEAIALVSEHGQVRYGELDRRANQLARYLRDLNVGPERRVVVFLERSPMMIEAVLGVLKAGGAYVPLDPSTPIERVTTVIEDSKADVVLTQRSLAEKVPSGSWRVVKLDEADSAIRAGSTEPIQVAVEPSNLAYVIYTSGSTGRPKGVLIEHANVTNFIRTVQRMFELTPSDHFIQFASLGFDVSVFETFGALLSGARLYVLTDAERRSMETLTRIMIEQEITVIDLPPAIMELLEPEQFPKLRVAFVGGEAFTGELTTRWAAGGRRFYNGYGPTETTVTVVAKRCEGVWKSSPPIGRAMDNHQAYAIDSSFQAVAIGMPGELAIAGAGVGRGYLDRPDLTAEQFIPNPFGPPGSRLYRTGDLVKWLPEGDLTFLGRIDRQVKIRGLRIELGEIESVLSTHPDVRQAVVEAVKSPQGSSMLVAYVVLRHGVELNADALRDTLAGKLPLYMIPSFFVTMESIPLTPSGKVDTRALPPVDFSSLAGTLEDETQRSPTERRVAQEIFTPLLAVPRFGIHDNFFALGGTSLQAIQVISRVRSVFGVEIPVAEFFQNPTVSGIATAVDRLRSAAASTTDDDLLAVLAEVEGRSDEEIERMLGVS